MLSGLRIRKVDRKYHIDKSLGDLARESGMSCVGGEDLRITAVEYDSRKAGPGALFVAVEGFKSDGHAYVDAAVAQGAAAVAVSASRVEEFSSLREKGIGCIAVNDTRRALSVLSSSFFGHPSRNMTVAGVTGTNGKTSITYMMENVFRRAGRVPGVIGTVNYRWKDNFLDAPNTTPESRDLHEILYLMKCDGVDTVIMEVSSHALELHRADDIAFDSAVFTNLTRDHMDFHKGFEEYYRAKRRLFELLPSGPKSGAAGFVNMDDDYGRRLYGECASIGCPVQGFGLSHDALFRPVDSSVENRIDGLRYVLDGPWPGKEVRLKLAGRFQMYNSLAAMAALSHAGIDERTILDGLSDLESVPGRFDVINSAAGFYVVVDYAHTGDALEKLLQSVAQLRKTRVITVFGCGGDRDRTKRPVMGGIAMEYSDVVYVTSDNPRTEDPSVIINEILAGIKGDHYQVIPDRMEAIRRAVYEARRDDIVVIAGKGHEDYQIIGKTKIHFDDREIAKRFILEREG